MSSASPTANTSRRRGRIEQRGEKTFRIGLFMGRDANGKRKYDYTTIHGSRKDAEKKLTELLRGKDTGAYVRKMRISVREYLEDWLDAKEAEDTTVRDYRTRMENDVYPSLGSTALQDLKPFQIQKTLQGLKKKVSPATGRPLSARTIRYTKMILKQALHHAVIHGLIVANPVDAIPRSEVPKERRKKAMRIWTKEQLVRFLRWAEKERPLYHPAWMLLATTGMRPQEALALRWDDIYHRNGRTFATIQRALKRAENGGYEVADFGKTDDATRTISLPASTVDVLDLLKVKQNFSQEWLFPTRSGRPLFPSNLNRAWRSAREASRYLGLPEIRMYDLRHTHASHLLQDKWPVKVVSERLGHADPAITQSIYQHVIPEIHEELGDAIETSLFGVGRQSDDLGSS